jgi:acyl-CoA synthetase (AMP-forming)/AMP-acid ligase II
VLLQGVIGGSQLAVSLDPHPSDISAMLLANAVNAISATPSMWRRLLMDPKIHKLSLAQITLGGEIADQAVLDALGRAFPAARITHIYASTEAGVGFAVSDRREGFPADWLRGDGPVPMKVDARGHLWLKPDHLPTGDAVVSRMDESGFLDTEDVVQVDQHRVRFAGRASGAINVGGQKAHPEEIEGVIRSVPGVVDVVVYGKKSSMMGQLVTADVVAEPDVDATALKSAIAGECRRQLPNWKVPATIRLVGSLTETAAGKRVRAL